MIDMNVLDLDMLNYQKKNKLIKKRYVLFFIYFIINYYIIVFNKLLINYFFTFYIHK
jgi:hypothetical protein